MDKNNKKYLSWLLAFAIFGIFILAVSFASAVFIENNKISSSNIFLVGALSDLSQNELSLIIEKSQTYYEIQLDIPNYLDQRLSKPNKFFSGRKIKIIKKDGSNLPEIPETLTLSKRDPTTKSLISSIGLDFNGKGLSSFSFTLPTNTDGYYTIDFNIRGENVILPIQIVGLTQKEKVQISSLPLVQKTDSSVSFIRRLGCNNCFWESVSIINPTDEKFGYLIGGSAHLVQTTDGWETSTVHKINELTYPKIRDYIGDPKLEFSVDNKLLISSLVYNPSSNEPISGGIYTENNLRGIPPKFTQTYLQSIPSNLPPEQWVIFDYEKIAVDKNPSSQFFGNTYMAVNNLNLGSGGGAGLITIKPNGQVVEKLTGEIGLYLSPNSLIVGKRGILYGGLHIYKNIIFLSSDGGETFLEEVLPDSVSDWDCIASRLSSMSDKAWYIYGGVELVQDTETGRLYAAWTKYKRCIFDSSFEFDSYTYDNDVFISYSDDGITWSNPIRVNDDFTGGDQGFPDIAVDENGIVYVVFLDHRDNQDLAQFDVYLAFSIDNGQTFSKNIKLNDVGVSNIYGGTDPGDYLDMISVGPTKIFVTYPCMNPNFESNGRPNDACVSVLNKPLNFQPHTLSQCSDGKDNEGDGFIDYPDDLGCDDKYDNNEIIENSIIRNYEDKDVNARIIMKIQQKAADGRWVNFKTVIDKSYIIPARNYLNLGSLWNGITTSISTAGDYRAVISLVDSSGLVMTNFNGRKIEAVYEFKVQ